MLFGPLSLESRLVSCLEAQDQMAILKWLRAIRDLPELIPLLVKYPVLEAYCLLPELNEHWLSIATDNKRLKYYLPLQYLPLDDFAFQAHPQIPAFHLLVGLYFYDQGMCLYRSPELTEAEREECHGLLRLAAIRYHFFPAVLTLSNCYLSAFQQNKEPDYIEGAMELLEAAKSMHGAPAFAQLAFNYYSLFCLCSSGDPKKDTQKYLPLLSIALENALIAAKLEDISAVEIHHAYFGKGFAEANALGLSSFQIATKTLADLIRSYLPPGREYQISDLLPRGALSIEKKFEVSSNHS